MKNYKNIITIYVGVLFISLLTIGCGAKETSIGHRSNISIEETESTSETFRNTTEDMLVEETQTVTENELVSEKSQNNTEQRMEEMVEDESAELESEDKNIEVIETQTEIESEDENETEDTIESFSEYEQTIMGEYVVSDTETNAEILTTTQRNSLNMLNYISVLTQRINTTKENRMYLETVQSSLHNDIYPNAVDSRTQDQINNLWNTIDEYRMISYKREQLDYMYEQNKAQTLKEAIPNPLGLLSTVEAKNLLKTAMSALYMAADSVTSYQSATTKADFEYLKERWDIEKDERQALSNSQKNLFNYMVDMTRDNGFPGEWALSEDLVKEFVTWANEENLVRKLSWFESNKSRYQEFRTYWLELAKCYYESGKYKKCLEAIEQYNIVATRIFRQDYDYAEVLPMAILSAKEIYGNNKYKEYAEEFTEDILNNCKDDWALRYFVAQVYIDLYANSNDKAYLEKAYDIAFDNVNILVGEQEQLNSVYLNDVEKQKVEDYYSKRQEQEVKDYNKLLIEKRKVELPPINEAFYLNCDLLYALADELNVSNSEKRKIDAIVHNNDERIFLTEALDNKYWISKEVDEINTDNIDIDFNGKKIIIPVTCLTERSKVIVTLSDGTIFDDWIVKEVERPKKAGCSEFLATLTSEKIKKFDYTSDDKISISIITVANTKNDTIPDIIEEKIEFEYNVIEKKTLGIIKGIEFERIIG